MDLYLTTPRGQHPCPSVSDITESDAGLLHTDFAQPGRVDRNHPKFRSRHGISHLDMDGHIEGIAIDEEDDEQSEPGNEIDHAVRAKLLQEENQRLMERRLHMSNLNVTAREKPSPVEEGLASKAATRKSRRSEQLHRGEKDGTPTAKGERRRSSGDGGSARNSQRSLEKPPSPRKVSQTGSLARMSVPTSPTEEQSYSGNDDEHEETSLALSSSRSSMRRTKKKQQQQPREQSSVSSPAGSVSKSEQSRSKQRRSPSKRADTVASNVKEVSSRSACQQSDPSPVKLSEEEEASHRQSASSPTNAAGTKTARAAPLVRSASKARKPRMSMDTLQTWTSEVIVHTDDSSVASNGSAQSSEESHTSPGSQEEKVWNQKTTNTEFEQDESQEDRRYGSSRAGSCCDQWSTSNRDNKEDDAVAEEEADRSTSKSLSMKSRSVTGSARSTIRGDDYLDNTSKEASAAQSQGREKNSVTSNGQYKDESTWGKVMFDEGQDQQRTEVASTFSLLSARGNCSSCGANPPTSANSTSSRISSVIHSTVGRGGQNVFTMDDEPNREMEMEVIRLKMDLAQLMGEKDENALRYVRVAEERNLLDARCTDLEERVDALTRSNEVLSCDDSAGLERINLKLLDEMAEVRRERDGLQGDLRALHDAVDTMRKENEQKQTVIEQMKDSMEELTKEKYRLELEQTRMEQEQGYMRGQGGHELTEREELVRKLQRAETGCERLQLNVLQATAERDRLKLTLEKVSRENDDLHEALEGNENYTRKSTFLSLNKARVDSAWSSFRVNRRREAGDGNSTSSAFRSQYD